MIQIVNRQRRRRIHVNPWQDFATRALHAIGKKRHEATIVFVRDATIRSLNRQFRGKDAATDVLSFPNAAENFETENRWHLGEVIISVDRATNQAKENRLSFESEVQQLILHGLLHLCGHDHESDDGEMNRLELRLRRKLGI
jgi:probable rRNA maturation factor